MRKLWLRCAVLVGGLLFGVGVSAAQGRTQVIGCYVAKPALTYSATGEPKPETLAGPTRSCQRMESHVVRFSAPMLIAVVRGESKMIPCM